MPHRFIPGNRLRRWPILAAAAALMLAVSGCTSSAQDAAGGGTSAAETVTVALPGSLSSLYPGKEGGILNYYVASIVQEGLVSLGPDGNLEPALADTWSQPDPKTYVYHLREDAKFQDGTPVTVDDVLVSIDKARDATVSPSFASSLDKIDRVSQTGDREITVSLSEPDVSFASTLSTAGVLYVTSKKYWEANGDQIGTASSLLLGTGPYKVTEYVPDSHVTVERVDTWWGGVPDIAKLEIQFIPDENTRLLARRSGEVDIAFNVPLSQAGQWESAKDTDVLYVPDLSYVGLRFDPTVAPFDDVHVRKAIAHSFDRTAVVDKLLKGHGEVATAITTPESIASQYTSQQARDVLASTPQFDFDLAAARAELAQSSRPNGFEVDFYTPATGPQLGDAAQALAQNLAQIGITLHVKEVPIAQWFGSLAKSGVGYTWYFSTTGDPGEVVIAGLRPGNSAKYTNPEVAALLAKSSSETDPKARIDLLLAAQKIAIGDDAAVVPLWWGQSATAFPTDLKLKNYSPFSLVSPWPAQLEHVG